jgi:VWFA-related protein
VFRLILGLILGCFFPVMALGWQGSAAPAATSVQSESTTAHTQAPQSAPASDKNSAEITSHDESSTFKVNVNLVLVRVVVRDAKGSAVGNLKKEDFQLFDNRKPQTISKFSVEQTNVSKSKAPTPDQEQVALPDHYIAYLFDDIHLKFGDLAQVRQAAERHLETLSSMDRAAIFTTSGRNTQDFTADRQKLLSALDRLRPNPLTESGTQECPDISYYMADLIHNKNDVRATEAATQDALQCAFNGNPQTQQVQQQAQQLVQNTATLVLELGDHETQVSLYTIEDIIKRIAILPGQRNIVLVSPGFYNPNLRRQQTDTGDRAVRSNVVINTLDARGLYTVDPAGDRSSPRGNIQFAGLMAEYENASASADSNVLAEFADATGGTFFHNSNDLEAGLGRLALPPEYSYLLAFSPQNLKSDGRYHDLKVTVNHVEKVTVQARKGYYAPSREQNVAEQAKQDIEDELFSQEELHMLPVELHTQFFKSSAAAAEIAVLVRVNVRELHFRKVEGRNRNDLTIVSALFDHDGNYIKGTEKTVEMRLRDETLQSQLGSGITLKSNFDVKPGSYLVRLVVRDAEGQISAENGAVQIPQ